VIAEIENYQKQLERWKKAIEDNDRETLKEIMREAGPRRRQLY
jgi:prephenate dehydrogenase